MMNALIYFGIIFSIWNVGMELVKRFDKPLWCLKKREKKFWLICSVFNGGMIVAIPEIGDMEGIIFSVFGGCLIFACITDCKACQVYQFIWWVAGIAAGCLVCGRIGEMHCGESMQLLIGLLIYGGLQELFFCRFYGRADCHAFIVCALMLGGMRIEKIGWLVHMLLAFGILAFVQLLCGNINRKGNLKNPVPFLPYITIAFWINLCCFSVKKMIY